MQETRDPRAGTPDARVQDDDSTVPEGVGAEAADAAVASEPAATGEPEDFKDRWLRAEAELQNFRRRAQREWEEGRRAAEEAVLLDMVALIDDLERAHEAAAGGESVGPWVDGVGLVLQKGRDALERQGVSAVNPAGLPFDPRFHEAILEVEATPEVAPGTVIRVVNKGYRRGDRALRVARVVVARSRGEA